MVKGIVQKLLVAVNDGIKFFWYSEYHMKVWGVQYILPAGIYPFLRKLLTHRATPVPAGVRRHAACYASLFSTCFEKLVDA